MSNHNPHPDDIDVRGTMNAWVIAAIAPILIMVLIGSLTYFLVDVFYQDEFSLRVKYILTLFVVAVVLIARISIEEGRGYATMYAIPLALATWFVTARFVVFEGGIFGVLNFVLVPFLLALIWWCADRLTWDCTVVDFSQDVSNQGLLESVADRLRDVQRTGEALADASRGVHDPQQDREEPPADETTRSSNRTEKSELPKESSWRNASSSGRDPQAAASAATFGLDESGNVVDPSRMNWDSPLHGTSSRETTSRQPWWKTLPLFQRKKNTPGVWVFYFSLAAIPIFGIGQAFVPASDVDTRRWLFFYFVLYTMAGLGLLLTTSLLSLQRYLRQRDVEMPNAIAITWVVVGGIGIVTILAVVWLLPRPAPEYALLPNPIKMVASDKLRSNRYGWGDEGVQDENQNSTTTPGSTEQGGTSQDSKGGPPSRSGDQRKPAKSSTQSPPQDDPANSSQSSSQQQSGSDQQSGEGGQSGNQQSSSSNSSASQSSSGNDSSERQQRTPDSDPNSKPADSQRSAKNDGSDSANNNQRQPSNDGQNQSEQDRPSSDNSQQGENRSNTSGNNRSSDGGRQQPSSNTDRNRDAQSNSQRNSSGRNESPSRSRDSASNSNPLEQGLSWLNTLANNLKWVMAAIVLAVIAYLAWKFRDQLIETWRDLGARWRAFWDRLFGRRQQESSTNSDVEPAERIVLPNFTAFHDPFESGEWKRWSPKQLLAYTFDAFEAWGRDRACPRDADLTPREYAQRVSHHDREVGRAAGKLAELYAEVAYSATTPPPQSTESVRQFWQVMRRRYHVA